MKTQSFHLTSLLYIQLVFVTLFFLRCSKYIPTLTTPNFACPWEHSLKACSSMPGKSEFLTFVSAVPSGAWRQWMIEPINFFGDFLWNYFVYQINCSVSSLGDMKVGIPHGHLPLFISTLWAFPTQKMAEPDAHIKATRRSKSPLLIASPYFYFEEINW